MRTGLHRIDLAAAAGLGALTAIGSLEPIRNYDYFWHLATGRWILEHGALPAWDPFTLASHREHWINLEWLFQVVLYPLCALLGHRGLTVLLALIAGAGTAALFVIVRRSTTTGGALFLAALAWFGAAHRIDLRPETAAIPFLVVVLALLLRPPDRLLLIVPPLLTIVWYAIHPSALLSPAMAGLILVGSVAEKRRVDPEVWKRLGQTAACGLALLVNPWFVDGVIAPVRLASMLRQEGLVNLEWLPSSPAVFPELYVLIAGGLLLLVIRRVGERRWTRTLLFAFFAILALRFVRNHAFFYPVMPLLLGPSIGMTSKLWERALTIGAAAVLVAGFLGQEPGLDVDPARFPVRTVAVLKRAGLQGHIYNPDQLGGYLVWAFYPERRALVDGRNELYLEFFRRFERARENSREWSALFEDYELTLAVEEYRGEDVEAIDGVTGETRRVPPSTVYFPKERWALIAFDEASMLFAERSKHPEDLVRNLELVSIVPDASRPEDAARNGIDEALSDLERLEGAVGGFPRLERLRAWLVWAKARESSVDDVRAVD